MVVEVKLGVFGVQADFVEDETTFSAFVAGRGSGKTYGGAVKLLGLVGAQKVNATVTAPTYKTLHDSTLLTCLEQWPRTLIAEYSKTLNTLVLTNGSVVRYRSTDDPENLRGPNNGVVWMDEAAQSPLEAWQILMGTLRERPGRAFLTTTPRGYNWLYQEFVAKARKDYKVFFGHSQDNPHNPSEFVQWLRESYQDDFALQEIEGQFVVVGGKCYFDVDVLKRLLDGVRPGSIFKPYVVGRRYAAAIDPAGQGANSHSLAILDCQTGEYVVDYTTKEHPEIFALNAYKIWESFGFPLLGIENNGVGLAMVHAFIGLGAPRGKLVYQDEKREKVGIVMSVNLRDRILVDLALGIRQGALIVYSRPALDEMFSFINTAKGKPQAAQGSEDDRPMAMAMANWVAVKVPVIQAYPRRENVYPRV